MQNVSTVLRFNKYDSLVLILFVVAAFCFAVAAYKEHLQSQLTLHLAEQGKYNASPEDVIGKHARFRGDLNSPFTIVEFGDYQCGPCRAENSKVENLLNHYQPKLRLVFRNLPLTDIHPLAMQAAIVAEQANSDSDFWSIHDLFYSKGHLDQNKIQRAQQAISNSGNLSTSEMSARNIIKDDMNEADSLGIQGTPTFVLCCPKGIVRRITSLDQVPDLIKS